MYVWIETDGGWESATTTKQLGFGSGQLGFRFGTTRVRIGTTRARSRTTRLVRVRSRAKTNARNTRCKARKAPAHLPPPAPPPRPHIILCNKLFHKQGTTAPHKAFVLKRKTYADSATMKKNQTQAEGAAKLRQRHANLRRPDTPRGQPQPPPGAPRKQKSRAPRVWYRTNTKQKRVNDSTEKINKTKANPLLRCRGRRPHRGHCCSDPTHAHSKSFTGRSPPTTCCNSLLFLGPQRSRFFYPSAARRRDTAKIFLRAGVAPLTPPEAAAPSPPSSVPLLPTAPPPFRPPPLRPRLPPPMPGSETVGIIDAAAVASEEEYDPAVLGCCCWDALSTFAAPPEPAGATSPAAAEFVCCDEAEEEA